MNIETDHGVTVSGTLDVRRMLITPGIITDQISSGRSPLKLFETDIASINPKGDLLRIGGSVVFKNGLTISNTKCNGCDSNVTLGCHGISLCLKCINDVVIHHQANQNWLETNGDPLIILRQEIEKLKNEIADLKKMNFL